MGNVKVWNTIKKKGVIAITAIAILLTGCSYHSASYVWDIVQPQIEEKYGEKFEYITSEDIGFHPGTHQIRVTCESFPGKQIHVRINETDEGIIYRDNYLAYKYEDEIKQRMEEIARRYFTEVVLFYDVPVGVPSENIPADASLEEYLALTDKVHDITVIVPATELTSMDMIKEIEKETASLLLNYDLAFAGLEQENTPELTRFELSERIKEEEYYVYAYVSRVKERQREDWKTNESGMARREGKKESADLLQQALGIDRDCAEGAADALFDAGGEKLVIVENMHADAGYTARAIDEEDNVYYMGFGDSGYLEIIRKDTEDGEIIFAYVDSYDDADAETQQVTMTADEIRILSEAYGDPTRIAQGRLYSYQVAALEQLRAGLKELSAKYPSHTFRIIYFEPENIYNNKATICFEGENHRQHTMTVKKTDDGYECADDYYGEIIQDEYDAYLRSALEERDIDTFCYTVFSEMIGNQVNETLSVEDLLAMNPPVTRTTRIYAYNVKSVEKIEETVEELSLYGSYTVYFVSDDDGRDIDTLEGNRVEFDRETFNCFLEQ